MTRILIVDDDPSIRTLLTFLVQFEGYTCVPASGPEEARKRLAEEDFTLVLLDVMMPGESGMDLLKHIRMHHPRTAVLMITGLDDPHLGKSALEFGAYGYMVKPFRESELLINIANAVHRREIELENLEHIARLQEKIEERTKAIEAATRSVEEARDQVRTYKEETVLKLARTVELRDEETGKHIRRIALLSDFLCRRIELSDKESELISISSMLHDVGKIAVPDKVLLKPGTLTPEEFEAVKLHTHAGFELLQGSESDLLQRGAEIALSHHEWWNGAGYPLGLRESNIPLSGRVCAVADVFDALTNRRSYRPAFPLRVAVEMMEEERETHFDPDMLDLFLGGIDEVKEIVLAHD